MTPALAKANSHDFLRSHHIELNENLPTIENIDQLRPQDGYSVAIRGVVLCHIIGVGFGASAKQFQASLENYGLFGYASAKEQQLLNKTEHTQQEKIDATWLIECVQSIAWCLGLADLDPFRHCDDNLAGLFPPPLNDPGNFISQAKLRPIDEIYQQVDLHYRLHWAARNARLRGRPCKIEEGFISERRKPLEWTIGAEPDWDEVRLDT